MREDCTSLHEHTFPVSEGAAPDKIHICRIDNRIQKDASVSDCVTKKAAERVQNPDTQRALLDLGVTIRPDTFGMPFPNPGFFMPDDFAGLKALVTLLQEGMRTSLRSAAASSAIRI